MLDTDTINETVRKIGVANLGSGTVDHASRARKQQLPNKYMRYLPASGFDENIQRFATGVINGRNGGTRHDPLRKFKLSDVVATISSARTAIEKFGELPATTSGPS